MKNEKNMIIGPTTKLIIAQLYVRAILTRNGESSQFLAKRSSIDGSGVLIISRLLESAKIKRLF